MSVASSRIGEEMVPGLDYTTVEGLQRKRLLAFVNHFVTRSVDSLTTFSRTCDAKLADISAKINKLENALLLLEAKLNSVPELATSPVKTEQPDTELIDIKVRIYP